MSTIVKNNAYQSSEYKLNKIEADCIITAAGLSSRMGQWKMMLPYRQDTILDASIKNALSICKRVILVTGFRSDELKMRYEDNSDVYIVCNENYSSGLFSSLQCAVKNIITEHFFIAHGDMPCLTPAIFESLWLNRGTYSLFPDYDGAMGHPVLAPATLIPDVIQADKSSNMRKLLMSKGYRCLTVGSSAIHRDIDTPEAYQRLLDDEQNERDKNQ